MSLLVFTPTYGDGPRPETIASVEAQEDAPAFDHEVSWHNPHPPERGKFANVVAQYQRAWELMLAGDYEALVTVEHDIVLPADALAKLCATDAAVVYGVYMLRHGAKTLNAWQYKNERNMGMSLSLYPKELAEYRKRGWGRVSGVGWGCTLIRREVVERLRVRSNDGDAGDLAFATDCLRAGILMVARFDVACDHIEPDGNVLMPYKDGGIMSRVYALQNVNANVDGVSVPLKKEHYYTLPVDVANELARAGYVKITNGTEQTAPDVPTAIDGREKAVDPRAAGRSKRKVPNALS